MKTNYVLIDYENIQPKNVTALKQLEFKVIVFVGANQAKISFDLASSVQALGNNAEYVKITGNGPNALDFHIAFYVGQLAEREPDCYFHIVSKDTGFDPLIAHLRSKKICAQRTKDLSEIPALRISNALTVDEKLDAIVKNLSSRGQSRPRKLKTLTNTINTLFLKKLEEAEVVDLVAELVKRLYVVVENDDVIYKPPISRS